MKQISAYLTFGGNCREAMNFYKECLGGKLDMQTVGESAMAKEMPADKHKMIMHASLTNDSMVLMASDQMMQGELKNGNSVNLLIDCNSEQEIKKLYSSLSSGGKISQKLQDTFWGATYGQFTDKYGINWMLNFDKKKAEQK